MKSLERLIIIIALIFLVVIIFFLTKSRSRESNENTGAIAVNDNTVQSVIEDLSEDIIVMAENLTIPWEIVFLPDGSILVSQRSGELLHLYKDGSRVSIKVSDVSSNTEGGLLGMALHPDFKSNKWLYLYITTATPGGTINMVNRYTLSGDTLGERLMIINDIPGALYHDGGALDFGPDAYLYITTGDATSAKSAQDINSLAGKILRVADNGDIPTTNPFGNLVYSYGHRNPQGLAWDGEGRLWSTEHGRTTATLTGMDELNLIEIGGNYGWPDSEGDTIEEGTIGPRLHSGPDVTWAPASAVYWDGSIFFGGLRGETLYEAVLGDDGIELKEHFKGQYGRIRAVVLGPDERLYISTSNQDGRGDIGVGDDKIISINPIIFR